MGISAAALAAIAAAAAAPQHETPARGPAIYYGNGWTDQAAVAVDALDRVHVVRAVSTYVDQAPKDWPDGKVRVGTSFVHRRSDDGGASFGLSSVIREDGPAWSGPRDIQLLSDGGAADVLFALCPTAVSGERRTALEVSVNGGEDWYGTVEVHGPWRVRAAQNPISGLVVLAYSGFSNVEDPDHHDFENTAHVLHLDGSGFTSLEVTPFSTVLPSGENGAHEVHDNERIAVIDLEYTSSGRLVCLWSYVGEPDWPGPPDESGLLCSTALYAQTSDDDGLSWNPPVLVDLGTKESFYMPHIQALYGESSLTNADLFARNPDLCRVGAEMFVSYMKYGGAGFARSPDGEVWTTYSGIVHPPKRSDGLPNQVTRTRLAASGLSPVLVFVASSLRGDNVYLVHLNGYLHGDPFVRINEVFDKGDPLELDVATSSQDRLHFVALDNGSFDFQAGKLGGRAVLTHWSDRTPSGLFVRFHEHFIENAVEPEEELGLVYRLGNYGPEPLDTMILMTLELSSGAVWESYAHAIWTKPLGEPFATMWTAKLPVALPPAMSAGQTARLRLEAMTFDHEFHSRDAVMPRVVAGGG